MKEVLVRAWCDACAAEIAESGGDVEPATMELSAAIGLVTERPADRRSLDLCERHYKALVEPLRELLLDAGQDGPTVPERPATRPGRTGPKPARSDTFLCLWCPQDFASNEGLRSHVHLTHGFRDGTLGGSLGLRCPVCGETRGSAAALGNHGRGHGQRNMTLLYRAAAAAGDPHGIVARRLKAGKNVTPR